MPYELSRSANIYWWLLYVRLCAFELQAPKMCKFSSRQRGPPYAVAKCVFIHLDPSAKLSGSVPVVLVTLIAMIVQAEFNQENNNSLRSFNTRNSIHNFHFIISFSFFHFCFRWSEESETIFFFFYRCILDIHSDNIHDKETVPEHGRSCFFFSPIFFPSACLSSLFTKALFPFLPAASLFIPLGNLKKMFK